MIRLLTICLVALSGGSALQPHANYARAQEAAEEAIAPSRFDLARIVNNQARTLVEQARDLSTQAKTANAQALEMNARSAVLLDQGRQLLARSRGRPALDAARLQQEARATHREAAQLQRESERLAARARKLAEQAERLVKSGVVLAGEAEEMVNATLRNQTAAEYLLTQINENLILEACNKGRGFYPAEYTLARQRVSIEDGIFRFERREHPGDGRNLIANMFSKQDLTWSGPIGAIGWEKVTLRRSTGDKAQCHQISFSCGNDVVGCTTHRNGDDIGWGIFNLVSDDTEKAERIVRLLGFFTYLTGHE